VTGWALRAVWLLVPLTVGAALEDALDGRHGGVVAVAAVACWTGWAVTLLATFVPHPLGLTALRLGGPSVAALAAGSSLTGEPPWWVTTAALAVGVLAMGLALSPATADWAVDGASYGPERRFALRVPLPLLVGPLPLAWLVAVGGVVAGPLLVVAGQTPAGIAAVVVGWPAAVLAGRAVHGLSQRFVVIVPAGFVLHDRAALLEPVLFSREVVQWLGPALSGTDAADLTLRSSGLVLEVRLVGPLEVPRRSGRRAGRTERVPAVLFSPLRPGRLLREAAGHRIPVA
jgi:hypothetical protein